MQVIPHLILRNDKHIFLSRRALTQKILAGHWHFVTGTIEEGETPRETIMRETTEEIGIVLKEPPKLVTTISVTSPSILHPGEIFRSVELFFLADLPKDQEPSNEEPHKQDAIGWFLPDQLPNPLTYVIKLALQCFYNNQSYAEFCDV